MGEFKLTADQEAWLQALEDAVRTWLVLNAPEFSADAPVYIADRLPASITVTQERRETE